MTNNSDFKRAEGAPTGILLNTNNDALLAYRKAKQKMSRVDKLESQLAELTKIVKELQKSIND